MDKFAIDVMSGDLGPEPILEGVFHALREFSFEVILIGNPEIIQPLVNQYPELSHRIEIAPARDIISMQDAPAIAVRKKKEASIVVATNSIAQGKVKGLFSPGNTGATLAASITYLGRLRGVKRPALCVPLPKKNGGVTLLIDGGANVDSKPEWLVQFAIMGEIYSREILGIVNPKLGLLANGEEDKKGNEVTLKAFKLFKQLPFDFIGNIEGRDLFGTGKGVDIVVCDGFIGNIVLKSAEGLATSIFGMLGQCIKGSKIAKTGAIFLKSIFKDLKNRLDYAEYGGVPLLGVRGTIIIGHGSSNVRAVKNALSVCIKSCQNDINSLIEENIKRYT